MLPTLTKQNQDFKPSLRITTENVDCVSNRASLVLHTIKDGKKCKSKRKVGAK